MKKAKYVVADGKSKKATNEVEMKLELKQGEFDFFADEISKRFAAIRPQISYWQKFSIENGYHHIDPAWWWSRMDFDDWPFSQSCNLFNDIWDRYSAEILDF
jgi:hypothetical protein